MLFGGNNMFISFGHTLRSLGKIRLGFGFRMRGWTAAIMIFIYAMLYMCWYMVLGMLWLLYGMGYLFFYLPINGIIKYKKNRE
jgi:hypothetical protein